MLQPREIAVALAACTKNIPCSIFFKETECDPANSQIARRRKL
jgi:hypothetical protein